MRRGEPDVVIAGIASVVLLATVVAFLPPTAGVAADFMTPKELLVQGGAPLALLAALGVTVASIDLGDGGLALFVALGLWAVGLAVNPEFAWRSFSVTTAGLMLFAAVRFCRSPQAHAWLRWAVTAAAALVALGVLADAYGLTHLAPRTVAPGGPLGNRNRAAHLFALTLPTLWLVQVRARRRGMLVAALLTTTAVGAALVVTRSRGAWLATLVCLGALALDEWNGACRPRTTRHRSLAWAAAIATGAVLGVTLPNAMRWAAGAGAYRESLAHLLDAKSGSGEGRMVQYAGTVAMIRDHPLLGVGPGNWAPRYLPYAADDDPSVDLTAPVPVQRVPQSDWLGFAAERGLPATVLLLATGVWFAWTVRQTAPTDDAPRRALSPTLLVLGTIGCVDALLLTPSGVCAAAVVVGALTPRAPAGARPLTRNERLLTAIAVAVLMATGLARSTRRLRADALDAQALRHPGDPAPLLHATAIAPDSYVSHYLLARYWTERGQCGRAAAPLAVAERLYPGAVALELLRAPCAARRTPSALSAPGARE